MLNDDVKRIKVEDYIWIIFIILSLLSIYANHDELKYIALHDKKYKNEAKSIGKFTLEISILIYIYFLLRNYDSYNKCSCKEKKLYSTKVFGSIFVLVGFFCLLYFQFKQNDFLESPEI